MIEVTESLSAAAHARRQRQVDSNTGAGRPDGPPPPRQVFLHMEDKLPAAQTKPAAAKKSEGGKGGRKDQLPSQVTKSLPPVSATYLTASNPRGPLDSFLGLEALACGATTTLATVLARHVRPAAPQPSVGLLLSPLLHSSRSMWSLPRAKCCFQQSGSTSAGHGASSSGDGPVGQFFSWCRLNSLAESIKLVEDFNGNLGNILDRLGDAHEHHELDERLLWLGGRRDNGLHYLLTSLAHKQTAFYVSDGAVDADSVDAGAGHGGRAAR